MIIKNASYIATFDDNYNIFKNANIKITNNVIQQICTEEIVERDDNVIDASGHILIPGLINTHHHFFQTLTRNIPDSQNSSLFDWGNMLYPIWAQMDSRAIDISTRIAIAELILSGCTTSMDHNYIWPHDACIDNQILAASEMGFRFHASRGSISMGRSQGGIRPDSAVEDETFILEDSRRAIETYHDSDPYAMTRIILAPCSLYSVSSDLFQETAKLARHYGVKLHTHLSETLDEKRYCIEKFDKTPIEYMRSNNWMGDDVWFAHMVHATSSEINLLGESCCGVAHCPSANMRLASGIAPVNKLRKSGVRVGLGVDGSSSNDSSNMLNEARQAMLLRRLVDGPDSMTATETLRLATRGGADILGRSDIGCLAPGMAADIVGYRLDSLSLAGGAVHDPVASLVFCMPPQVDLSIINGRIRVLDGHIIDVDLPMLIKEHNSIAKHLVAGTYTPIAE